MGLRNAAIYPFVLAAALAGGAAPAAAQVCTSPAKPCPGFKENDLSFRLPKDGVARADSRSPSFFAVILRSADRCSIKEPERRAAQALFPRNKVFYTRFECDGNPENNVTYTNVGDKVAFIAVYAGAERTKAQAFLEEIQSMGKFPGANLRRMEVVFVSP